MSILVTIRTRFNPLIAAAVALVAVGLYGLREEGVVNGAVAAACGPEDEACLSSATANAGAVGRRASTVGLPAAEACRDAGYLCADLAARDFVQVRRWKDFGGTVVVHVPRPDFEDSGDAIALQRAAALGIRAWNNEPFPILVDMRGDRNAHFSVNWSQSLGGSQIGEARTRWSAAGGLEVLSIQLTTRSPYNMNSVSDARAVRLTAAHEMGHALGLPHSDSSRDVMYPTNTATSVSAQDRRSMEVLYGLEDGVRIVR